ncbi:MAG: D-alanyl-D-alanine carboxypeptidase family protein [Proteocatella sp.]
MKKRVISIITVLILTLNSMTFIAFAQPDLNMEGNSTILLETRLQQVIYKENEETRRLPASVTKIMTVAVAFDKIEEKEIPLETFTRISKKAASTSGARIDLKEGELISLDSLLSAIIINSANNASVALSEYFAGSEAEFVKLMNEKAAQMGLENTHFISCNGLTLSSDHYSTAEDLSKIALELIDEGDIFSYSSLKNKDINIYRDGKTDAVIAEKARIAAARKAQELAEKKAAEAARLAKAQKEAQAKAGAETQLPKVETPDKSKEAVKPEVQPEKLPEPIKPPAPKELGILKTITLESTNKLLQVYDGVDGMKTGWMGPQSGYCFVGTAVRGDVRLLTVSLGAQAEGGNFRDTAKMLDYGFKDFRYIQLEEAGYKAGKLKVAGSFVSAKGILDEDLVLFGNLNEEDYRTEAVFEEMELPVEKGQKIGNLNVYAAEKLVYQTDIVSKNNVKKSVIISMMESIKGWFSKE